MLKDLIFKSKRLLAKENDNLPLKMRGELEVIVRDKDDNITSYQKDHNTITDYMKHEIIHLLAGDVFSNNVPISDGSTVLYSTIDSTRHDSTKNEDGMLFSKSPYFFDLSTSNYAYKFVNYETSSNTGVTSSYICPRYPVKMLFGTGHEYKDWDSLSLAYGSDEAVNNILKYTQELFTGNIQDVKNYYSGTINVDNSLIKCRTVQPLDTLVKTTPPIVSNDFGIVGAIKDCFIENNGIDITNKYSAIDKMAKPEFRGVGRPSFIYAERSLVSVIQDNISAMPGYVKIGKSAADSLIENKLTFSVIMPRTNSFYPYNGFILKEAGLFSDSLFRVSGLNVGSTTGKMPCGTMLAKRYISPVLKTEDNSIEFIWSIYISTT